MTSNNSDAGEYGLKALAEQIFGTKVVKILPEKKMSYRDIWELSSPTTQCANTIGNAIDGVSDCWLCGYKINTDINKPELNPECEHVLPVGQALVFLDLYKSTIHKGTKNQELIDMLKLEYRWSHSVCNRLKSDDNFLSFNSKGKPVVLNDAITNYLEKLYKKDPIKALIKPTKAVWIKERLTDISKQLELIINFINKKTQGLLLLAGVASLFEPDNIAVSVRNTLTPEKVEVVPNIETISSSFNGNEFRKLRYFIEYKNNLASQISALSGPLSVVLTAKISKKDKAFINSLITQYDLGRGDSEIAIKMYIMDIIKDNLITPFDNVMTTDVFKDLYYTYSYFKRSDRFNPFVLELIYMCILCVMNKDLSKNPKLTGTIDNDIEAIQQIWLAKCAESDYKIFFCSMTDMFISSGVISKDIITCVKRIDCTGTTKLNSKANFINSKMITSSMWDDLLVLLEDAEQQRKAKIQEEEEAEIRRAANILESLEANSAAMLLMGLKGRS
jgi:hypothetical protein